MWKKLSFISLVLSFLFLLSACTNSPQEDSSQLEEVNPKTYLTVWAWDKEKYVSLIQKAADYFKNDGYDNVVIQVEDVGQSEILSRLESSFESDNVQSLPDIVLLSDESIAGMIGGYEDQFVDLRQEISMSQFAAYKTATVSFEKCFPGWSDFSGCSVSAGTSYRFGKDGRRIPSRHPQYCRTEGCFQSVCPD